MRNRMFLLFVLLAFSLAFVPGIAVADDDPLLPDDDDDDPPPPKPDDEPDDPLEQPNPGDNGRTEPEVKDVHACKECTKKKMCDLHKQKEKEVLDSFKEFKSKKWTKEQEKERVAEFSDLIEEIALLTVEHPQYKSKAVADALVSIFCGEKNEGLRIKTLDYIDTRQHASACLKGLQKSFGIKDFNDEDMICRILSAIAYFESEGTVSLFYKYYENSEYKVQTAAIECIIYVDGQKAIGMLIELLGDLRNKAASRGGWGRWGGGNRGGGDYNALFDKVERALKDKTNHTPNIKDTVQRTTRQLETYKDWKTWWAKNGGRYKKSVKTNDDKSRMKANITKPSRKGNAPR